MGLTENEFLKGEIVAGPHHPAFGYLVRSEAFYLAVTKVCEEHGLSGMVTVLLNKKDIPHLIGYQRSNIKRFEEQGLQIKWHEREALAPGQFEIMSGRSMGDTNLDSCGDRGGSEEPTKTYLGVRRGERRSDNEGIRVKANWYKAISMLPF
jgi:hypothetical protein